MMEGGGRGKGMAQTLTEGTQSSSRSTGQIVNVVLWVLQVAAGMFLMVGFLKLSGDSQLVGLFEAIGLGQWFRYLTGTLEVAGAVFVFFPRTRGLGAVMLAGGGGGGVVGAGFLFRGGPLAAGIF